MQSMKPPRKAISIQKEIEILLAKAEDEVHKAKFKQNKIALEVLENIRKLAATKEGYTGVKEFIIENIRAAKIWAVIMDNMRSDVLVLEDSLSKRELYNESWWQKKKSSLQEAYATNPVEAKQLWLETFAEALLAWELGICDKLVREFSSFFPFKNLTLSLAEAGTLALQESRYEDSLEMLFHLISGTSEPEIRAILEIFVGRIYQFTLNWPQHARQHFETARELAPQAGQPCAALSNHLLETNPNQASRLAQRALELSHTLPDGYVAMGMWAENQNYWDKAKEQYNRAVDTVWEEKDPYIALTKLLAPFSGNLGLVLAQRLYEDKDFDLALYSVEQALLLGVKGKGSDPSAPAFELKSNILEKKAKPVNERAKACYEAGWRYLYNNELDKAIELLTRAKELYSKDNRDRFLTYCHLADAWRRSSFKADGKPLDPDCLEQSSTILEKGLRRGRKVNLPDARDSWVYTLRALICEGLATLPKSDPRTLWWEAVTYLERAILLRCEESYRWAYLGRFFRNLELETCALQATEKALAYGPGELLSLEERAVILTNTGEFDQALEVIDQLRNLASNWADAGKAYILLRKDQPQERREHYQEALELLNKAVSEDPNVLWIRGTRALCNWLLQDLSAATEDNQFIWDKYKSDPANQKKLCQAALHLNKVEEYLDIHLGLADATPDIQTDRGILLLARGNYQQGDLLAGENGISQALDQCHNHQQLSDLLNFDLVMLETFVRPKPHGPAVQKILEHLRKKIDQRMSLLREQTLSVEQELQQLVSQLKNDNEIIGWPWVGAHASLGRFYVEQERWPEAALTYKSLLGHQKEFPEARLGLEAAVNKLLSAGDDLLQAGRTAEATAHYQTILMSLLDPDNYRSQADLESRLGYAFFESGDFDGARADFVRAVQSYRDAGEKSPGEALGRTCAFFLRNPEQYWGLDAQWQAHQQASDLTPELLSDFKAARDSLAIFLADYFKLSPALCKTSGILPAVTPIVMDLGPGLVHEVEGPESPMINTYLPAMRQRIQAEMGVPIPGVKVWQNDNFDFNEYVLMLDEISLEGGKVELGDDPKLFLVGRLEALIYRNLEKFLGIQEVENLLQDWGRTEEGGSLIRSALPDRRFRLRFARLLRALVAEKVPITRLQIILETIKESKLTEANSDETMRAVRLQLKDLLPGNDKNTVRLALSQEIEAKLRPGVQQQDSKRFLALPPEETQDLLAMIREVVDQEKNKSVLVTRHPELRPFLRQLIRLEFPDLMVLAQEEILTEQDLLEPAPAPEPSQGDTIDGP